MEKNEWKAEFDFILPDLSKQAGAKAGPPSKAVDIDLVIKEFRRVCEIDFQQKPRTIKEHERYVRRYLGFCGAETDLVELGDIFKISGMRENPELLKRVAGSIREFLAGYKNNGRGTYANATKAMRVFHNRYLGSNAALSFKVPQPTLTIKKVPSKADLNIFYDAIFSWKYKALFLFYASSGRRRNELLDLDLEKVDLPEGMLTPINGDSPTKRVWYSFVNAEALEVYREYREREANQFDGKLFGRTSGKFSGDRVDGIFKKTSKRVGIKISPQVLRDWFCNEMGKLGVQDRYVDAFCGRVPKSVLARSYTDYSPERLKEIYDKAGLKVLS